MISHEALDGIVASQPFDRHGSIVLPLYRHGIPIFTEKPLASSVGMGERMVAELGRYGSWHMVGYHKRNDPAVKWAVEQATERAEKLRYVRICMPPGDWIAGGFDGLIRTEEPSPPVAPDEPVMPREYIAFVNYYIHQVNLMRLLLGAPFRVVFANTHVLIVESESGQTGTIEMAPYQTDVGWEETILMGFDDASIHIALPAPLVQARCGSAEMRLHDRREVVSPVMPAVSAMKIQAQNFVSAIRGEVEPTCQAAEALEDLRVADRWHEMIR